MSISLTAKYNYEHHLTKQTIDEQNTHEQCHSTHNSRTTCFRGTKVCKPHESKRASEQYACMHIYVMFMLLQYMCMC